MFRKSFPHLLLFLLLVLSPSATRARVNRLDAGLLVTEASTLPYRSSFRHGIYLEGSRDDRLGIQVAFLLRDWMFGPSIHEDNDPQLRLQAWYAIRRGEETGELGWRLHISHDPTMSRSWQTSLEDEVYRHHSEANWWRGALQARWYGDRGGDWRWIPSLELGVSRYSGKYESSLYSGTKWVKTQPWAGVCLEVQYRKRIFMDLAVAFHGDHGWEEIYAQARGGVRIF